MDSFYSSSSSSCSSAPVRFELPSVLCVGKSPEMFGPNFSIIDFSLRTHPASDSDLPLRLDENFRFNTHKKLIEGREEIPKYEST